MGWLKFVLNIGGFLLSFWLNRKKAEGVELGAAQQEVKQQAAVIKEVANAQNIDRDNSLLSDEQLYAATKQWEARN